MKTLSTASFGIFILLIIMSSCRHTQTFEGKAIIVSRSIDVTLKDSSMVYGKVYSAQNENEPLANVNIWIDGTSIKTYSDNIGFFSIKVLPGTYTIQSLGKFDNQDMIEKLTNITLLPNEKVEVKFLQKITIE
jgi:hypothetical protein